jgi:hypothetical protein
VRPASGVQPADIVGLSAAGPNISNYVMRWTGRGWAKPMTVPGGVGQLRVTASGLWVVTGQWSIVHWNGKKWTTIAVGVSYPGPNFGISDLLPRSDSDVWAAGQTVYVCEPGTNCNGSILIKHWNGASWSAAPLVNQPSAGVSGATTISPGAAGQPQWTGTVASAGEGVVYEHWTGRAWTAVRGPSPVGSGAPAGYAVTSFTAHIPGTNATWGYGLTNTGQGWSTAKGFIQLNAGG